MHVAIIQQISASGAIQGHAQSLYIPLSHSEVYLLCFQQADKGNIKSHEESNFALRSFSWL